MNSKFAAVDGQPIAWVDGVWHADAANASVSVLDHGLLYGDGVFEGLQAANGAIFRLDAHMDRLYRSGKYMEIEIPLPRAAFAVPGEQQADEEGGRASLKQIVRRS